METDRFMKWYFALPKLLLRETRRGGKGKGNAEVAARFAAVREDNWGELLQLLARDEEAERRRRAANGRRRRVEGDPDEEKAKLSKTVLCKISRGQVGQARRLAVSPGVARMSDLGVKETMQTKYPARSRPLPASVVRGTALDSLPGLKETMLDLMPGVSGGFGSLMNEFLRCAAQNWDDQELARFEEFCLMYVNVELRPWVYCVANSASSVALFKSSARDPSLLRPLAIKASPVRMLHREVILANRASFREHLEPEQLALSPGCGSKIVHIVRMMLEARQDFVCVALDFKNAHNEVSRAAVVEEIQEVESLRHLALHMASYLAPAHRLDASGEAWGVAEEGEAQGDPEASAVFVSRFTPM